MAFAWASLAILLLLLPGIFFFIGLATYDRLSREVVRSSVVSEVAMAVVIAAIIHVVSISILSAVAGFRLSRFAIPLVAAENSPPTLVRIVSSDILPATLYLGWTTLIGLLLGLLIAEGVVSGRLRRLARHRWIYDLIDADRKRVMITAYVMMNIVEDSKVLMYRGRLHDIFLNEDGNISYLILKDCSRYYMSFKENALVTSKQLEFFSSQRNRPSGIWNRLLIEGPNIVNVLFDSSREIKGQAAAQPALERAFTEALARWAERQQASTRD
jgi:hypothetical protein